MSDRMLQLSVILADLAEALWHWNGVVVDDDRGRDNKALCIALWDDGSGRVGTIYGYSDIDMNLELEFTDTDQLATYLDDYIG